jgi:CRISPR-associated protein Cst1
MTAATSGRVPLLTGHPLQRCGARAIAALAGVPSPADVTPDALEAVVSRIQGDVVCAAAAPDNAVRYDWWKVLFALYPNSPATHSKRSRVPEELSAEIRRLFGADRDDAPASPCALCGQPAATLWGKDKLPMFDTLNAVNVLPPGLGGWPVCRACRIAMWALPYGAWVTAGSATVLTCASDAVERRFAERNVRRAKQIQQLGFSGLPAGASPETITLAALREHAGTAAVGATLWMFKNDNQEPWLRVEATRGGIPRFLAGMFAEPQCRAGWGAMVRVLTERDRNGALKASGVSKAARTLFGPVGQPGSLDGDRLERELLRLAADPGKFTGPTLTAWRALCCLYLKVVHEMDTGQVKPACELIADWIMAEQNPRGRFNRYVKAAARPSGLQKLLMEASARLLLDGGQPADITGVAPALLAPDEPGWRLRGLLFFDVVAELVARGAPVGRAPVLGEPEEPDEDLSGPVFDPPASRYENEEYA